MRSKTSRYEVQATAGCAALAMAAAVSAGDPGSFALRSHNGLQSGGRLGAAVAPAGDINQDGVVDYLVGSPGTSENTTKGVAVRSGADGTLLFNFPGEQGKSAFGYSTASAGDVNNDGVPDIIVGDPDMLVGCMDQGGAVVYSGADGSMLFFPAGTTGFEKFGQSVAAAGDVDGDGHDDFIVGAPHRISEPHNYIGYVAVFSGYHGGTLFETTGSSHSKLGWSVAGVGDVNGDGFPDVAAGAPLQGKVYIYDAHNGQTIRILSGYAFAQFGWSIANIGDTTGDGVSELAVGSPGQGMEWWRGRASMFDGATGQLLRTVHGDSAGSRAGFSVAAAGDVNGDGTPDFVVGSPWSEPDGTTTGRVTVHSGVTGQAIRLFNAGPAYTGYASAAAGIGDLNGDGLSDLLVGAPQDGTGKVFIYPGGVNEFGLGQTLQSDSQGGAADQVISADMNGDGAADTITLNTAANSLHVYMSQSDGSPGNPTVYPAGKAPTSVAAGDFNNDGDLDLAVVSSKTRKILLLSNFGGELTPAGTLPTGSKPRSIVAADVNGDGRPDLAVTNQLDDTIWVYQTKSFQAATMVKQFAVAKVFAVQDNPVFIAAGNLNGDTNADLIVAHGGSSDVSVLRSKLNGGLNPQLVLAGADSAGGLVVADLNGDGFDDLASIDSTGALNTRKNVGNGTFLAPQQVTLTTSLRSIAALDFDHDGYTDLAAANANGTATLLINNLSAQFETVLTGETGADARWITVGDADGDGDKDLVTANQSGSPLSVLLNLWMH
ncbi:MAG: FG-GAP-like repeat-containing protein [Phycisphaerales bacterium]|nr:FG-GAP-like repeat-containing protein [Phycisphaerales bacterium]MCI0675195.1 FG-GAP-like repeat-containing protein [Phycisphaerales bacterium]